MARALLFFDPTILWLYHSFNYSTFLWLYYPLTLEAFDSTILVYSTIVFYPTLLSPSYIGSFSNFPWQCKSQYWEKKLDFIQTEKSLCKAEENTGKALQGEGAHWTLVRPGSWHRLYSKRNEKTPQTQNAIQIKRFYNTSICDVKIKISKKQSVTSMQNENANRWTNTHSLIVAL